MNESVIQCFWNKHPRHMDTTESVLVGVAVLVLSVISFILNTTLGYLVCKKSIFDGCFRWHVVALVTAALSYLLTNCSILIPTALFGLQIDDPYNTILTVFDVLGFLTQTFATTLIAIDRFVLFYVIGIHHSVTYHRPPLVSCISALPWVISILLTLHMSLIGCHIRTDPFTLTYSYDCSYCGYYRPIMYYLNFSLPVITFTLYCAIYVNILVLRHRLITGVNARERTKAVHLVMQCSLICVIQFASSSSFYVVPMVMSDTKLYLTMLISTLNSMTNPCVMFAFQPRLRRALCQQKNLGENLTRGEGRFITVNSVPLRRSS